MLLLLLEISSGGSDPLVRDHDRLGGGAFTGSETASIMLGRVAVSLPRSVVGSWQDRFTERASSFDKTDA